jgi:RNA polymerase sigma-70 factor (ECF subfamily)
MGGLQGVSDESIVSRCRAGDAQAWNELVERFSRYVYAICVSGFRLSREDAEDVFQDVFAKTYVNLDKLRDDSAIRPWIAQLTRRACIDHLRGAKATADDEVGEIPDPVDTLADLERALDVHDAMQTLGDACNEILDRFFTQDETYRTIAEALEIAPGTIASRISRCLEKLRQAMEDPATAERHGDR